MEGRESLGVPADVIAFFFGQVAGLHPGDHILGAVEGFQGSDPSGPACHLFGARHGVDVGVISAFFAGQVEQALLLAQDLGHQDGRVELPLVAVVGCEGRRNPYGQPGGGCLPQCLSQRSWTASGWSAVLVVSACPVVSAWLVVSA